MKKIVVLLIFLISATINAPAQLSQNSLTYYNELDGTSVFCTLADSFGNIWIGSQNGLVRFDGYEFKRFYFDPNDSGSLKDIVTWSLFEDRKGNVWIGGLSSINKYNPKTKSFKRYSYDSLVILSPSGSGQSGIASITEDNNGRVYFGVASFIGESIMNALVYYDEKTDKMHSFKHSDNFKIDNVYGLATDKQGTLWLSGIGGFYKIDKTKKISEIKLENKEIKSSDKIFFSGLKFDSANKLWMISTQNKLCSYNTITNQLNSFTIKINSEAKQNSISPTTFSIDKDGNIFIGTNNGILLFDKKTETFERKKIKGSEKEVSLDILSLSNDSFGNLWIGTISKGLYKYEKRISLEAYVSPINKTIKFNGWISNIIESNDGKIWFTSEGSSISNSVIVVMDVPTRTFKSFNYATVFRKSSHVFSVYQASKDEIYFCNNDGVFSYSIKNNNAKQINLEGVPKNISNINRLYTDTQGNFWVFALNGIYKKSKNSKFLLFSILVNYLKEVHPAIVLPIILKVKRMVFGCYQIMDCFYIIIKRIKLNAMVMTIKKATCLFHKILIPFTKIKMT